MRAIHALENVKRKVRNFPIKRKLALSFLILIILPVILIGLFSFYKSSELLKNKTQQYTKDILMETGNNVEVKLKEIERTSFQIISSNDIQLALRSANLGFSDEYEKVAAERMVDTRLRSYISSDTGIVSIQILSLSETVFYLNPDSDLFSLTEADKQLLDEGNGRAVWFNTDPATQNIAVGRAINSLGRLERVGYLIISFKESSIFSVYKNTELFNNGEFYIINPEGRIVSYKDKKMLGSPSMLPVTGEALYQFKENSTTSKVNGRNYYITYRAIEGPSWKIVSVIPAVEYEKEIIWMKNWTILICVSCCLSALLVSIAISDSISKPVRKLSAMMIRVGGGDFNALSTYESKDEMGILSSHFNKMVLQVQQLIQEVYQEQLLKQKAELKSLRMQINPHFLYNTLESINSMSRIKGVPEIGKMVKALGDLMRSSISGDDFISVEDEMKNVNNYLMIQRYRFGDRLEMSVDISPEIMSFKLPKLILQPIVENAIVHGIENLVENGRIEIIGQMEGNNIVFLVKDNGAGMDEKLAAALLSEDAQKPFHADSHTHIGLQNASRRIKMYYGQEYGIAVESHPGCGTTVKIILSINVRTNVI